MTFRSLTKIPLNDVRLETAVNLMHADPGFVCINSGPWGGERFSIIASDPVHVFSMAGGFVTIDGHTTIDTPSDAFKRFCEGVRDLPSDPYLPFSGGAIGYIGFDGAKVLRGFNPAEGFSRLPQCKFGIYRTFIIFDHAEGTSFIVAPRSSHSGSRDAERLLERFQSSPSPGYAHSIQIDTAIEGRRQIPSDVNFKKLANAAFTWLRAENLQRIHIARHVETPATDASSVDFLNARPIDGMRFMFTHEGAASVLGSGDLLLEVSGDAVHSMMPSSESNYIDEHRDDLQRICVAESLNSECAGTKISFSGRRRPNMGPVDALISLLPATRLTGSPKNVALSYIDANEEIHRRFYGGAFGTIDSRRLLFRTIDSASSFADGMTTKTVGADLTADVHPQILCERIEAAFERLP